MFSPYPLDAFTPIQIRLSPETGTSPHVYGNGASLDIEFLPRGDLKSLRPIQKVVEICEAAIAYGRGMIWRRYARLPTVDYSHWDAIRPLAAWATMGIDLNWISVAQIILTLVMMTDFLLVPLVSFTTRHRDPKQFTRFLLLITAAVLAKLSILFAQIMHLQALSSITASMLFVVRSLVTLESLWGKRPKTPHGTRTLDLAQLQLSLIYSPLYN
ncbi:hypothetical protein JX266_014048 [Neoarthrinium moseri]|nr:hypothetical protein JX266_014048 [Neoarthrinium moseri]